MKAIIDASVAIKWFYTEIDQSKAIKLLEQIKKRELHIIVPLLFFYEVGNVFATKKEELPIVQNAFFLLRKLHFSIQHEEIDHFPTICAFTKQHEISFYDAVYASLMEKEGYPFITADSKLYHKLHSSFPLIQLL